VLSEDSYVAETPLVHVAASPSAPYDCAAARCDGMSCCAAMHGCVSCCRRDSTSSRCLGIYFGKKWQRRVMMITGMIFWKKWTRTKNLSRGDKE
jgi:hypothetical protein